MSKWSTVYLMAAWAWIAALVGVVARVGLEGWGALLGIICVVMVLACLIWSHRAWHHEHWLGQQAARHAHPSHSDES